MCAQFQLRKHGFTNIDGLDPSGTLLQVGRSKGLFDRTCQCFVLPDKPTPIRTGTGENLVKNILHTLKY